MRVGNTGGSGGGLGLSGGGFLGFFQMVDLNLLGGDGGGSESEGSKGEKVGFDECEGAGGSGNTCERSGDGGGQ